MEKRVAILMSAHPELQVVQNSVQTQSEIIHADVIRVTLWHKMDDHVTMLTSVRQEHPDALRFVATTLEAILVDAIRVTLWHKTEKLATAMRKPHRIPLDSRHLNAKTNRLLQTRRPTTRCQCVYLIHRLQKHSSSTGQSTQTKHTTSKI